MKCPRCQNEYKDQMYSLNNTMYCRKCIKFKKVNIDDTRKTKLIRYCLNKVTYHLEFELSKKQKLISEQLKSNYNNNLNSLVLAVCGSGKTEIVFETICDALNKGHRVCFCVPRKEIAKELYERIKSSFLNIDLGICIGGMVENENAQMIVCTMHQLYRFENNIGFELMIADEVDAFPFYGNEVLNEIFSRCTLKNYIKLSATFFNEDIGDEELLVMNRRYHGYDLPVPKIYLMPQFLQKMMMIHIIKKISYPVLLFVPTCHLVKEVCDYLKRHKINALGIYSSHTHIDQCLTSFKENKVQVLVTTTLLERGITIKGVQVIVYHAENSVFNKRTLIQIAGRVGRKPGYTTGMVCFLAQRKTKDMSECISTIRKLNTMNV